MNTANLPDDYRGHRGNVNLKRLNVSIEWTPELAAEWLRCADDVMYFCENYVKIVHVDQGLIPFVPRGYQRQIINTIADYRNTIVCTARQAGKTTSFAGFVLWYVLFQQDKSVAILANKAGTAREILNRIQLAYENLPKWLQQGIKEWNKGSMVLENNSRVIADATTGNTIRGYAFSMVIIDEAAHIEGWDDFFTSVYPVLSSGQTTKLVLVSTPNGLNHFHSTWVNANKASDEEGAIDYKPIKVMWYEVPGRDEAWKKATLDALNNDMDKFAQEFECEFLGSSGTLISGKKLKELVAKTAVRDDSRRIWQYQQVKEKHQYIIVADTSHGKGLDYSAFSVIDITQIPYQQVCVFKDNKTVPAEYAQIIYNMAKYYNNAYVLAENNDIGEKTNSLLWDDYEYDNLLSTGKAVKKSGAGKEVSSGFGMSTERGVRTTSTVKSVGCAMLKLLVEQDTLILNDQNTITELSKFSRKGKSYEAEAGSHDDLTMGLVIFAWLSNQPYFKDLTELNTLMSIRDKTVEEIEADLQPVGVFTASEQVLENTVVSSGDLWFSKWIWEDPPLR